MSTKERSVELPGQSSNTDDRCTYQVPFGGPRCERKSYRKHDGQATCIFHYPGDDKGNEFHSLFKTELMRGSSDLRGVWFPGELSMSKLDIAAPVDLSYAVFNGRVDFWGTVFQRDVSFSYAHFKEGAAFSYARFKGNANFDDARFSDRAYFYETLFECAAVFTAAKFNDRGVFGLARFGTKVTFGLATFDDDVEFTGVDNKPPFRMDAVVDFQFARFRKPQGVRFQTLTLRPHWFVNVDTRDFQFIDVGWNVEAPLKAQVASLKAAGVVAADRLLGRSFRHLAVNAEQNHRYDEASVFRYLTLDTQRRATYCGWAVWRLLWWYWIASGYGERSQRAFVVLLALWLTCAALYMKVGFAPLGAQVASSQISAPLPADRALTYSAAVILLQKPEPRPFGTIAQCLVLGETLLGPLQIGLMGLAIRRQFMR